jgi:cbb3-type cytochrome oxidase subunit 3
MGTFVFIIAVLAAIAFAWYRGRKSTLHEALRARPPLDADAIRVADADRYTLDPQTTRDVLRALGAALEVDPGRLRLVDSFDALWDMNPQAGFHQRATFETWVLKHYPRLPESTQAATVGDLIAQLQRLPLVR